MKPSTINPHHYPGVGEKSVVALERLRIFPPWRGRLAHGPNWIRADDCPTWSWPSRARYRVSWYSARMIQDDIEISIFKIVLSPSMSTRRTPTSGRLCRAVSQLEMKLIHHETDCIVDIYMCVRQRRHLAGSDIVVAPVSIRFNLPVYYITSRGSRTPL